jgi:hypothetical protein
MKNSLLKKRFKLLMLVLIILIAALTGVSSGAVPAEYWLEARTFQITMPDGTPVTMWGFASCTANYASCDPLPSVPGPQLTATPGLSLTIHLRNKLTGLYKEPVSIVIPGQIAAMTPTWTDNSTGNRTSLSQRVRSFTTETPADNGATVITYVWNSVREGTYLYQSGTHPAVQIQMGLYGTITANAAANQAYTPSVTNPNTSYTNEFVVVYSEIDPALHDAVATGQYGPHTLPLPPGWLTSTVNYDPQYFLVNGQPYSASSSPSFTGNPNDTTLIRFLNAGLQTHVPVLQGPYIKMIAEDGNLIPYPKTQYSLMLTAGKTIDAIIKLPSAPGYLPLYDRALDLTNGASSPGGMLTYLKVAAATQYTLNVNKTGSTGTGRIVTASLPGGIDCGADCSEQYNTGLGIRLSAIPAAGSYFSSWSGGGCSGSGSCMVTMDATKTVTGIFLTSGTYAVTPSVAGNGNISPLTPQIVATNNTATFTVYPNAGYHIQSVGGTCGGTLTGNKFTTLPVTVACSVIANFAINTYTVTPTAGPNGNISPAIPQTVNYNNTTAFLVAPAIGYHIQSVNGCGGSLNTITNTYTTGPVTADCTVVASFAANTFTVTPSAGPNGSIYPSVVQTVGYNTTAKFTITPTTGYHIQAVNSTCGAGGTLTGNLYTTAPVKTNCTVNATFAPVNVITPNGGEIIPSGSAYTIRWAAPASAVRFTLEYSLNSGATWVLIASGVTGTSRTWTVPRPLTNTTTCLVRVTGYNASNVLQGSDTSNAPFTIEVVRLTAPNGGNTLISGTNFNITWITNGTVRSVYRVTLMYTADATVLNPVWNTITTVIGNFGVYTWRVPVVTTTNAKVRVILNDSTNIAIGSDDSDNVFTIHP